MQIEDSYFKILFQESDKDFANSLKCLLGNAYQRIKKLFDIKKSIECNIVVCHSIDEYILRTGKSKENYQSWMVGYSDSIRQLICLISPDVATDFTEKDILKIAVHELVHIIFDNEYAITENEVWLSEGIAILLAEQTDLNYVDVNDFPKISEISGICESGETPVNFCENRGYDYAGIYVWFFIEKFGANSFISSYKNELNANELIYKGFEREAIKQFTERYGS